MLMLKLVGFFVIFGGHCLAQDKPPFWALSEENIYSDVFTDMRDYLSSQTDLLESNAKKGIFVIGSSNKIYSLGDTVSLEIPFQKFIETGGSNFVKFYRETYEVELMETYTLSQLKNLDSCRQSICLRLYPRSYFLEKDLNDFVFLPFGNTFVKILVYNGDYGLRILKTKEVLNWGEDLDSIYSIAIENTGKINSRDKVKSESVLVGNTTVYVLEDQVNMFMISEVFLRKNYFEDNGPYLISIPNSGVILYSRINDLSENEHLNDFFGVTNALFQQATNHYSYELIYFDGEYEFLLPK